MEDVEIDDDPDDTTLVDDCLPPLMECSSFSSGCSGGRPPIYVGNSIRTKRRKRSEMKQASSGTRSLTEFFNPIEKPSIFCDEEEESFEEEELLPPDAATILINSLSYVQTTRNDYFSKHVKANAFFLVSQANAVRAFLQSWAKEGTGFKRVETSEKIASIIYNASTHIEYRGRLIRKWADYFRIHGEFPCNMRGLHRKVLPLILDEDIAEAFRSYLRSRTKKEYNLLTGRSLAKWANSNLPGIFISERTAQRWMNHLGFHFGEPPLGVYVDGHEREDVIRYRAKFVKKMLEYRNKMTIFRDDGEILPQLDEGCEEIVLIVHDECIFYANEGRKCVWFEDGKPPLKTKGQGRTIMVSEFLCACHGRLCFGEKEARRIIYPGANHDGYWDNDDLIDQLKAAIPIFEALHPGKQALFAFDNSTNHRRKADNALVANRLNLGDGWAASAKKQVTPGTIMRVGLSSIGAY